MTRGLYWSKTALNVGLSAAVVSVLGFLAGVGNVLAQRTHDQSVPLVILLCIGFGLVGAIGGGGVGILLGLMLPVRGGPPFLLHQLPIKLAIVCVMLGSLRFGVLQPMKAQQSHRLTLEQAIMHGTLANVQAAVDAGARPDTQIGNGTALFLAAQEGKLEVCRYLLSRSAKINSRNLNDMTPLMIAIEFRRIEVAKFLLEAGADPNLQDHYGKTPLMMAAENSNGSKIIQLLLAHGAEINHISPNNLTALNSAIMSQRIDNVELLLNSGANPNLSDIHNYSPLDHAFQVRNDAMAAMLKAHGAH